jgi:hypothetical protein
MPPLIVTVELRRCAVSHDGRRQTYHFSFQWSAGGRTRPAFIRPQFMPPADVDADWPLAWYEVEKVGGVWKGRRRMAQRFGGAAWTPQSPAHDTGRGTTASAPRPR